MEHLGPRFRAEASEGLGARPPQVRVFVAESRAAHDDCEGIPGFQTPTFHRRSIEGFQTPTRDAGSPAAAPP